MQRYYVHLKIFLDEMSRIESPVQKLSRPPQLSQNMPTTEKSFQQISPGLTCIIDGLQPPREIQMTKAWRHVG